VRILVAAHHHVYQVTCPACGEEYTISDLGVERVKE
jgi:phage terminase large subunit GpA-like protein